MSAQPTDQDAQGIAELEAIVLGAAVANREAAELVVSLLDVEYLTREQHRRVLAAMRALHGRGDPIDRGTVLGELIDTRTPDAANLLHDLVAAVPSTANVQHHLGTILRRVRSDQLVRELREAAQHLESGVDPTAIAGDVRRALDTDLTSLEPYPLYGIDDLDQLPTVEWVVDGLVQDREGLLLYGQRGTGKSLVALDLALHIADGRDWRGRAVDGGHVVVVALENADALPERVRAWQASHPDADLDRFHFSTARIRATGQVDEARLHATLDQLPEPPKLVIIDTQQRFAAGLDELSSLDMQVVIDWLDRLRDHTDHAVGLVHHAGKDPARGARGSSVLEASFTTVASVDKSSGGVVTVKADKINNGPEGWDHAWKIAVGDHGPYLFPLNPHAPLLAKLREIRDVVDDQPGITKRDLDDALTGKAATNRSAIEEALRLGVIVNRGTGRAHAYHPGSRTPESACPDPSQNGHPGTHVSPRGDTKGHSNEVPA